MAAVNPEVSPQDHQPWTKQIVCRYFVHRVCKNGDSCRYSHDLSTAPNLVCRYYQKGHCSYGDKCRYDHVKADKQIKKIDDNDTNPTVNAERKTFNSVSHDVHWADAAEFVPGKQYRPRNVSTYSSVVQEREGQAASPSKVDEICPFALNGECINGESCAFVHGLLCDMCGLNILHPEDVNQQEKHKEECVQYHEEDMKESFKIAESKEAVCGICMEVVWEKSDASQRKFGILENCNHMYCLECIRKWRCAKAFKNKVIKSCPECRVSSSFVTPSDTWIEDKEEKKKLIEGYKKHLSDKPCRYFDQGKGDCPFGANCFYLHAYPDGTKQDRSTIKTKRVYGSSGTTSILPFTLFDFIEEREGHADAATIMELLNDDLDLVDEVYLFGNDFGDASSTDDDYDEFLWEDNDVLWYGADSSDSDFF